MMDRTWAIGLSQEDFKREFQRRNPHADTVPCVSEWVVAPSPEPFMRLPRAEEINPNLDGKDMTARILENESNNAEKNGGKADPRNTVFVCECGMAVKSQLGFWNHQQKCEKHLNSKVA